jgi:threonine/homoserine/homoserine lactone efflux protein
MFGITNYSAFVIAFTLLLLLPGPGNLALITSAGKGGLKGGVASVFGLLVGDQVLLWLTVAGVAALLSAKPLVFHALQWLGAAYLAWLGFKMLTTKAGDKPLLNIKAGHYFRQTLVITLFNPKAIMFYVAFFPQFIDPLKHQGMLTFGVMAATIAVLGFIYCMSVVLITHYMAERIRANPRVTEVLQKIAGVFLIGFGVKLALGK